MAINDELFVLIRSLSKNEKGYFRKHAALHKARKKTSYLILFDAMEKQEVYDEKALIKTLKKEGITGNISVHKHYLFQILVKTTSQYHAANDESLLIFDLLQEAVFLRKKGLDDSSEKMFAKVRDIALRYNKNDMLLKITLEEIHLLSSGRLTPANMERIRELYNDLDRQQERIRNTEAFRQEYIRMNSIIQQNNVEFILNRDQEGELDAILAQDIFSDVTKAITFEAQCLFHLVHGHCAHAKMDFETSYLHKKSMVILLEGTYKEFPHRTGHLLTGLNHLLNICIRLHKKQEFYTYLDLLESLDVSKVNNGDTRKFTAISNLKINWFLETDDKRFGPVILPGIEAQLKKYNKAVSIQHKNTLFFNITQVYFMEGQYRNALYYINQVLTYGDNAMGSGMFVMAKILNLLIHYRLGNYELLETLIRQTEKDLSRAGLMYDVQESVIGFVKKWLDISTGKNHTDQLKKLYDEIDVYSRQPQFQGHLNILDVRKWLALQIRPEESSDVEIQQKAVTTGRE